MIDKPLPLKVDELFVVVSNTNPFIMKMIARHSMNDLAKRQ